MTTPPPQDPPLLRRIGNPMVGLGTNFAIGMAVFTLLGLYIGKRTGHLALCVVAGALLGLGYGGYEVWKLVRKTGSGSDGRSGEGTPHG